jgi:NitT/TauT family transport system ATP-binding protein
MSETKGREIEITIKNLGVTFQDNAGNDVQALTGVNLDIYKGEFVSLLGPSGCGKTTLLRSVADLQEPTEGSIHIAGMTPKEVRLQQKFGFVFQQPVLFDWRTVKKNVELPLEVMYYSKEERSQRADEMLEMVGLTNFANHFPKQLSGGMQQRVNIARAFGLRPEILLMDEPFSALDEFTKEKLHEDLLRIWRQTNKTILFVTHNIQEAVFLSSRVCVLSPQGYCTF